jgi:hypothetical protein
MASRSRARKHTAVSAKEPREERAYATGIQALLWGRPLLLCYETLYAALKAGGVGLNHYRQFPNLKTAKDRFVNTPNNVSIDGYSAANVRNEPVVLKVPPIQEDRWYIVQVGDYFDEVVYNIGGINRHPDPARASEGHVELAARSERAVQPDDAALRRAGAHSERVVSLDGRETQSIVD